MGVPHHAPMTITRTQPDSLSARLDGEWTHLCSRPAVLRKVQSWNITPSRPQSLPDLLAMAGHRRCPSTETDAVLHALVERAATDVLVGRIVLERILPGLLTIVRTEQWKNPQVDAFDLLITEAWVAIRTFPVASGNRFIAPRLLNTARQRTFTHPRRLHRHDRERLSPSSFQPESPDEREAPAFEELIRVLIEARDGGLPAADLELFRRDVQLGSATEVAASYGHTTRALRYRRRDAVDRVRKLVVAA